MTEAQAYAVSQIIYLSHRRQILSLMQECHATDNDDDFNDRERGRRPFAARIHQSRLQSFLVDMGHKCTIKCHILT